MPENDCRASGLHLRVRGIVQGVGFRPYVWRLAGELGLQGWVRNEGADVTIAVDGENLPEFLHRLPLEIPPLARVDRIDRQPMAVDAVAFAILESVAETAATPIGPDVALCPACLEDICNPGGRRWRYAFTTCTDCGPRYTVSHRLPYDRKNTSLADFALCADCAAEYGAPVDRRFHAETNACPVCGPQLRMLDAAGQAMPGDPLAAALQAIRAGQIVAIKGLGGFHLACDARNPDAVAALRSRKQREAKPFAVMALNRASLAAHARIGEAEAALLGGPEAPVVLCPKGEVELPGVAPALAWLGVMLPASPLQMLLWHEAAGRPAGTGWLASPAEMLLVMTSANPHGEPLVGDNDEALTRLAGIADVFLVHDRDIVARCDDSVVRVNAGHARMIRRARGHVPLPVKLTGDGPKVLALGGHLKNTVCVMQGDQAYLSQHVGTLDNVPTRDFLAETVQRLLALLDVRPELIAHDLHPDYASTLLARELAEAWGVPALAVGHHHAHLGAICAEHGVDEPLLGLALDGFGLGPDGANWGGELLRIEGARCARLGHLSTLAMPGGDRAAREPWRMGVSALHAAGLGYRVGGWLTQRHPGHEGGPVLTMLARKLRSPQTSSLGRWFDAAAGLLGLRDVTHYEGQAAMELESLALQHGPVASLPGGYGLDRSGLILDFSPLVLALLDCREPARGAALFHATVAEGLANWLLAAVDRENVRKIAVAGGCAMNGVLMDGIRNALSLHGLSLLEASRVPPNDGGLALGQAWVARRMFEEMKHVSGHTGTSG